VSTHDDEYRRPTGRAGGSFFDSSGSTPASGEQGYADHGYDQGYADQGYGDKGYGDKGYGAEQTTVIPPARPVDDDYDDSATRWHGGLDLGLLLLRLVLGGTMLAHGLQKMFGLFGGPGIDGFAQALGNFGYTSQTTLLSWITAVSEVAGGGLLILGLFTPLAAAAILGVTSNIVYLKYSAGFFAGPQQGFELELLLGVVALALLFTGSGRVALDVNTPWRRKPLPFAVVMLLVAAAASVAVILVFR